MTRIVLDIHSAEESFSKELKQFLLKNQNITYSIERKETLYYEKMDFLRFLSTIGMPLNLKGATYLAEAACFLMKKEGHEDILGKELYLSLAQRFRTSSAAVERSMRTAITALWEGKKENKDFLLHFCEQRNEKRKKPSNLEFLSFLMIQISKEWVYLL